MFFDYMTERSFFIELCRRLCSR